jgi:hypothetical protein
MTAPNPAGSSRRRTNGWLLDPKEREELLKLYPPAYPDVVAHHVTLSSGPDTDARVPGETRGTLVGHVDDGQGVEAFIVEIAGTTDRRTGGTYHITWSLDRAANREARESNDVIARQGWTVLTVSRPLKLMPAYWEREVLSEPGAS